MKTETASAPDMFEFHLSAATDLIDCIAADYRVIRRLGFMGEKSDAKIGKVAERIARLEALRDWHQLRAKEASAAR